MCADPTCREPIHHWFGLTYSSFLVMHRSVLQAMPQDFQRRLVALLEELEGTVDTAQIPGEFWVRAHKGNRFIPDPFVNYRYPPEIPMRSKGGVNG